MNTLFSIGIALQLFDKMSSPLRSVKQTTDNFTRSVKALNDSCTQFSRGFAVMVKTIEKAKAPFEQIRGQADKLKDIGKGMALKGTTSMMLGLAPSVDAAGFEKGMAEVATLTDMSVKEFQDKYGKQIIDLSVELGQDPAIVIKGLYQAISAGIDPKDAIDFMKKVGQAAIAGVSDVFTATDLATTIKNAFNVPVSEMGKVNDIIFQTVRKGKTTFSEIAYSFSQVGASAASAGISLEHVQAAVAQMTLGGVKTERAYTSLKYVIDALVAPSNSAKKAFEKLGLEINAETVRQKDLLGVMDELMQALGGLSEKEQAELISDIFGSQEAQMFVKDFGVSADKYKQMLKDIKGSTGVTEDAYKKMADTSAQQFEKMKQAFKAIRITAGATILPVINNMLFAIKAVLTPLANFAQRHKILTGVFLGGVVAISGVVAVLGVMGVALGMAIKGYTNFRVVVSLLTTNKMRLITAIRSMTAALIPNIRAVATWAVTMAKTSFSGFLSGLRAVMFGLRGVSIAFLTSPIGWISLAIAGAGLIIYKFWGPISGFFRGLFKGIADALKSLEPAFGILKKIAPIFFPILIPLKLIYNLIKWLIKPINDTGKAAENLGLRFGRVIGNMLSSIFTLPAKMLTAGSKIVESLWKGMMSMFNRPVEAIKNIAQKVRNFLPFSPAKEGPFKDLHKVRIIETIADAIKPAPAVTAMKKALEPVKAFAQPLMQPVKQVLEPVKAFAQPLMQPVKQVLEPVKAGSPSFGARSSVTVNYSPSITISGGTFAGAKEDFVSILKQHQQELLKLIKDAQAKQARLAY